VQAIGYARTFTNLARRSSVCFPPEMVECSSSEWASAERYRHWKGWDRFELGETDHLAERAHQAVGGYLLHRIPKPPRQES